VQVEGPLTHFPFEHTSVAPEHVPQLIVMLPHSYPLEEQLSHTGEGDGFPLNMPEISEEVNTLLKILTSSTIPLK